MITLAITNYNRYEMLLESFADVIHHPLVSEVVIVDDCSIREIQNKLRMAVEVMKNDKIKLHFNTINLGVYRNKKRAIELSANPWVILLDSDNVIKFDFIDTLFKIKWNPTTSYLPDFAKPHFDYRAFSGYMIDKTNVSGMVSRPKFDCLINTMNGFYHRDTYLNVWDGTTEPIGADSAYMNYLFLKEGGMLQVVEGLQYEHRVHNGSHFQQHAAQTDPILREVMKKLKQLH